MSFDIVDVVILETDLPQHNLVRGTLGTVVEVLPAASPAYLIEFADDEGQTLALVALLPEQLSAYTGIGATAHAAE